MSKMAIMSNENFCYLIKSMGFCAEEPVYYDEVEVRDYLGDPSFHAIDYHKAYDGIFIRMDHPEKEYMWSHRSRDVIMSFESKYAFRTGNLDATQKAMAAKILENEQVKSFSSYWGLNTDEEAMLLKVSANINVFIVKEIQTYIRAHPLYKP